jgi:hypothetical protein
MARLRHFTTGIGAGAARGRHLMARLLDQQGHAAAAQTALRVGQTVERMQDQLHNGDAADAERPRGRPGPGLL